MARSEATLITLMSAFEASFPSRKAPAAFLSHKAEDRGYHTDIFVWGHRGSKFEVSYSKIFIVK